MRRCWDSGNRTRPREEWCSRSCGAGRNPERLWGYAAKKLQQIIYYKGRRSVEIGIHQFLTLLGQVTSEGAPWTDVLAFDVPLVPCMHCCMEDRAFSVHLPRLHRIDRVVDDQLQKSASQGGETVGEALLTCP